MMNRVLWIIRYNCRIPSLVSSRILFLLVENSENVKLSSQVYVKCEDFSVSLHKFSKILDWKLMKTFHKLLKYFEVKTLLNQYLRATNRDGSVERIYFFVYIVLSVIGLLFTNIKVIFIADLKVIDYFGIL